MRSCGPPNAQRVCVRAYQEPAYASEAAVPAQARGRLFANFTVYKGKAAMALKVKNTGRRRYAKVPGVAGS